MHACMGPHGMQLTHFHMKQEQKYIRREAQQVFRSNVAETNADRIEDMVSSSLFPMNPSSCSCCSA